MAAVQTLRVVETQARAYRRIWRGSVITTFLNPVLYLAAMGVGLGVLVDEGTGRQTLEGFTYLAFLAPGLLAASTMQTGAGDGAWPVMDGIKWHRQYEGVLCTPVSVRDLVAGHLLWVSVRLLMVSVIFGFVMVLFGAVGVDAALRAVVPAVATGMAFFPISQLPGWMQPVAYVTPLWHGVEVTRAWALGLDPTLSAGLHLGYLAVWIVGGWIAANHFLGKRMIK
jgi:lipooligosaccharide transport system permease protein